jgi:hypothetical protein
MQLTSILGDPIGCYAPNTCLYRSISTFGLAYCGVSGSNYAYATACSDYTALTTEPPYETLHWSVLSFHVPVLNPGR